MNNLTRQVVGAVGADLVSLVWLLIYAAIFYVFYSMLKRMEKTLQEIKELLEGKAPTTQVRKP
jgi:hypothetical protein